jgi:regulator of protease activity HflC (stomatin/prohibitin superfamily)
MNNRPTDKSAPGGDQTKGRERDAYRVQSAEGQNMDISLNVQWRIDPTKAVQIHNGVRENIEELLLRPVVMAIVKNAATKLPAITAYSGDGLVKLQTDIHQALLKSELSEKGVIVDNFVIEHIELDAKYIEEITAAQIAGRKKIKEDELAKAADAAALRAKAEAQADLNKRVVEAERDKQVGVLKAEQEAKMAVLAAEADKQKITLDAEAQKIKTTMDAEARKAKLVLEATGQRDASLLEAEGILAKGKATAESQKLQLSAYAVPGAESFVQIEVAKAFATSTQGISGYLPSDMNVYTLGDNFSKAVQNLMGRTTPVPAK